MYSTISPKDFAHILSQEHIQSDSAFIDVRTPEEYAQEHIKGVSNIPLNDLPSHASRLTEKKKIYVHCRSGARSLVAIEWLAHAGGVHAELINLDGGIESWKASQLPVEK